MIQPLPSTLSSPYLSLIQPLFSPYWTHIQAPVLPLSCPYLTPNPLSNTFPPSLFVSNPAHPAHPGRRQCDVVRRVRDPGPPGAAAGPPRHVHGVCPRVSGTPPPPAAPRPPPRLSSHAQRPTPSSPAPPPASTPTGAPVARTCAKLAQVTSKTHPHLAVRPLPSCVLRTRRTNSSWSWRGW